eukprot:6345580-Pyramimonas_sp.AAC.1
MTKWAAPRREAVLPAPMLDEVLLRASQNVSSDAPWTDLRGPASAVVTTALRLAWALEPPCFLEDAIAICAQSRHFADPPAGLGRFSRREMRRPGHGNKRPPNTPS